MEPTPTYLGLDLAEVRTLTRLERLEFETRRDRSRAIVRRRWIRWTSILLGYAVYVGLLSLLRVDANWLYSAPIQLGIVLLIGYEKTHAWLARGEDEIQVAVYRGAVAPELRAQFAAAAHSAGLPQRSLGETVEVAVLMPSGRVWSVDGFRARRLARFETRALVVVPEGDEDGRALVPPEVEELRNWSAKRLDGAQRMTMALVFMTLVVGGFVWALTEGWRPWVIFGAVLLVLGALVGRKFIECLRLRHALKSPRLRAITASPDTRSPAIAMTTIEGTGLPWTVEGRPAPWRYGGEPRRVRDVRPARHDERSL